MKCLHAWIAVVAFIATPLSDACAMIIKEPPAAKLVRQLGSDDFKKREEASARLREMGHEARQAVQGALNSPDLEVKLRAQELWKTLRWFVVPKAEKETLELVEAAENGKLNSKSWQEFSKKFGAPALSLLAEMRGIAKPRATAWHQGVSMVLTECDPIEIARLVSNAGPRERKAALLETLSLMTASKSSSASAANMVRIQIALWNYREAFDYGREAWPVSKNKELPELCAIAVDRGKLTENLWMSDAAMDEPDPAKLFKNASFYTALATRLHNGEAIRPMLKKLCEADVSKTDNNTLQSLVINLMKLKLLDDAVALLRSATNANGLYMRSIVLSKKGDKAGAGESWSSALKAVDADTGKTRKAACYYLADLMGEWNDRRAETIWQKILETDPDTVYDANACFRLGAIYEKRKEDQKAADYLERGLEMMKTVGGALAIGGSTDKRPPEEIIREKIDRLRGGAAKK